MQTNSLSLHDNQEMLHDREQATATKRKCARERKRRGATESTQWLQNKREREKRGAQRERRSRRELFPLVLDENWMMCVSRVLRCFLFIWYPIYIHPQRMLFIHKRMISCEGGTAYLMNVVGLLLTADRYWLRDYWQNLPTHRQNRPGTLGFRPGIWLLHGRKMAALPFSGLYVLLPIIKDSIIKDSKRLATWNIFVNWKYMHFWGEKKNINFCLNDF